MNNQDAKIEKALKVIISCKTKGQLKVAVRFANLASAEYHGDKLGKCIIPLERAIAVTKYRLGLLGSNL